MRESFHFDSRFALWGTFLMTHLLFVQSWECVSIKIKNCLLLTTTIYY
jgi:hypothetical protein